MEKQKAISLSLYGDMPIYAVGAIHNIKLAKKFYPGWDVVIHVEKGHYALNRLRRDGAVVVERDSEPNHLGMLWRFDTCSQEKYSHVIIRDADSRITHKEAVAVDEWVTSGKCLHRMRDHKHHANWPIMGGMFGVRVGSIDMRGLLCDWRKSSLGLFKDDQIFLKKKVWPLIGKSCLMHSSLRMENPFPSHEESWMHIGQKIKPFFLDEKVRMVVLNAEHYPKRRKCFTDAFNSNAGSLRNIPLEWFSGTPKELDPGPYAGWRKHWYAATSDHLSILAETLDLGYDSLIMLEDDARFTCNSHYRFWRAWCALPEDWRGVRLGVNKGAPIEVIHPGVLGRSPKRWGQMLANYLSREGMEMLHRYASRRRHRVIDGAFADLRRCEPVGWYQPIDPVVWKDSRTKQQGRGS